MQGPAQGFRALLRASGVSSAAHTGWSASAWSAGDRATSEVSPRPLRADEFAGTAPAEDTHDVPNTSVGGSTLSVDQQEVPTCRYKDCRKIKKTTDGSTMVTCGNGDCGCRVHTDCLNRLKEVFGATNVPSPFCSKRCLNAIKKQSTAPVPPPSAGKRRVSWDNDGPTPDVSSSSVLLDWMTTEGNYTRYRGGDAQSGATKLSIAGEISRLISNAGITTLRTPASIQWKMSEIESSFKMASDWLAQTGQGVTIEADIKRAVESRCAVYYRIESIMAGRPSVEPLALNSRDGNDAAPATPASDSTNPATVRTGNKSKRTKEDDYNESLLELKADHIKNEMRIHKQTAAFKARKIEIEEKKFDLLADKARYDVQESRARTREAEAKAAKLRQETKMNELQAKVVLLRERRRLQVEGVGQEDIDRLLPLTVE